MNIQRFLDVLPDAPEWGDLPLPETDDTDAKKDAPRDSFKSFQDKAAYILHRNMLAGNATPAMLRDAVRRLHTLLEISGEVGDYRAEAQIVQTLTNLMMVAQQTVYS